jgi:hypothetical protein
VHSCRRAAASASLRSVGVGTPPPATVRFSPTRLAARGEGDLEAISRVTTHGAASAELGYGIGKGL